MLEFNYYMPSRIFFGKGSLENLGTEKLPGKKALIVTSAGGSMRKYGYLDRVTALLDKNHTEYVLFEKILPNPIKSHVMEGAQLAREAGCDFVIGLGGGSSIDSSKSIAVMAANDGDYWESDPRTVVTKEETGEKIGFGYDKTFPYFSIVDPDLMMSIPPYLTAYQGFDALFHSTEGYIANISNFMSDMYALKAIELIGKYLVRAVKDGSDEEARAGVALANTLSGFVESTSSCTSEHSLEHALSGYHPKLTHGAGLIMVSAAYYETFAATVPERYVQMAKALGRRDASQASDFIEALKDLQKACGVDDLKMSDFDVDKDDLKKYALHALDKMGGLFEYDPYKLTLDEIVNILEKSYR